MNARATWWCERAEEFWGRWPKGWIVVRAGGWMAFGRQRTETRGVGVTWKAGLPGGDLAESGQALEEKSSCITAAARFGPVAGGANGVKKGVAEKQVLCIMNARAWQGGCWKGFAGEEAIETFEAARPLQNVLNRWKGFAGEEAIETLIAPEGRFGYGSLERVRWRRSD